LTSEEGGGWLVEFPDLPGCVADGETPEEAVREAEDAVRSWLETARLHGDPIPQPSRPDLAAYSGKWVLRAPKSLHKRLAERAREEGVSLNTLALTLLALGLGERSGTGRA
jgi:antitoxin HicB